MSLAIDEPGPTLSESRLREAEQRMGVKCPESYRTFLLEHNGGRPSPNEFPITGLAKNPVGAVGHFFGIDVDMRCYDLLWNAETMGGRLPPRMLAIADNDCGDLICLSVSEDDCGAVYFWDHEGEPRSDEVSGGRNLYFVAKDFECFLRNLR